jgi:hypothetical protein
MFEFLVLRQRNKWAESTFNELLLASSTRTGSTGSSSIAFTKVICSRILVYIIVANRVSDNTNITFVKRIQKNLQVRQKRKMHMINSPLVIHLSVRIIEIVVKLS